MAEYTEKKATQWVATITVFLFFLLYSIRFFTTIDLYIINGATIIIGLFAFAIAIFQTRTKRILWALLLVDTIMALAVLYNQNVSLLNWLLEISMQGIAILMCAMPKTYKVPSAFFLMTVVYLLIYSGLGNSPADVLNHASENHISTILLSYFCLYCINSWFGVIKSSKIFVLWLACFLLVLWSNSRMGLLSFLFMFYLLVVFFVKPRKISSGVIYFFYAIITIILIFICVKLFQEEVQKSLLSEGRIPLWESYLRETLKQPLGWILGTRFLNTSIFIALGYNLHNAFLHMHLIYGITPILVIGIQLLKFFRKKIILLNICAIVLLVRSLTDSIFTGDIATLPLYFFMTVSYMWCERGQMNES